MSVASVALRGEATGVATCWNADVVATAKRDLKPGEMLDGEGGYTVWGKLLPADTSVRMGGLPLGLAHDVKVTRAAAKGRACRGPMSMSTRRQSRTGHVARWSRSTRSGRGRILERSATQPVCAGSPSLTRRTGFPRPLINALSSSMESTASKAP